MALYVGDTKYKVMVGNQKEDFKVPPPYDAQVEWLSANGTMWIETDFTPLIGDTIHAEFLFNADTFGSDNFNVFSAGSGTYRIAFNNVRNVDGANHRGAQFKYFSNSNTAFAYGPRANTWYTLNINSNGKATIGNNTATSQPIEELDGDTHLWFFRLHGSTNPFKGKLRSFYITRNGNIVANYIPVRKGNTGYLYDTISNKRYGNAGTGSFTYGNDVTT